MKKKKTIQEEFDAVASQISVALRQTFSRYRSLTDHLADAQRRIESAKSVCQAVYRIVDGPCWEVLYAEPRYRTDAFIQRMYDAMTNTSLRKWTRDHLRLLEETKGQLESVCRKAQKLKERFDADPTSTEAKATAVLLKRMSDTRDALSHRMEFTVRKFLELRLCVLKSITGTSEMMFKAAEGVLTKEDLEKYSAPTKIECDRIANVDALAIRKGTKRK